MSAPRLDSDGLADLRRAVADVEVVARYGAKVVRVPGSGCWFWSGAVSGRGHGRFWVGPGRVVIAHRFAFALAYGVDALDGVRVLGHRCDNPLCQRVGPEHVVPSSPQANRREWAVRRHVAGGALGDPRGARRRARELRDLAREDPVAVARELDAVRHAGGEQLAISWNTDCPSDGHVDEVGGLRTSRPHTASSSSKGSTAGGRR